MSDVKTMPGAGCSEYNALSRRQFLSGTAKAALLAASVPAWMPQVAFAQNPSARRDVVVSLFLRGGADGLTLCPPHGDADYYKLRPTIAIPEPGKTNGATALNGLFGLPPAMTPLLDAYAAKQLLIVHAAGSIDPTHSHFDAQHYMEVGKPEDPNLATGWLGRHLLSVPPLVANAPLRALSIANALPQTLVGSPDALPVPDPAKFGLAGYGQTNLARRAWLETAYNATGDPIKSAAENTLNTFGLLEKLNFNGYVPSGGAMYPNSHLGQALKAAAVLIKAQVGVEAIHVDLAGGWDTHQHQGPIDGGMARLMADFSASVAAFHADVFSAASNVTLVAMSEFGRTAHENSSQGTDHGHGNVLWVMGDHINGGQVLTNGPWPGLAPSDLYIKQDLQVTTDYRNVLAEIVAKRLDNAANLASIFPDFQPVFPGVTHA